MSYIYLDNAATTKPNENALNKALELLSSIDEIVNIETTSIGENEAEFLIERTPQSNISMKITEAFGKNGIGINELRSALLTLEEIFIKLTNNEAYEETDTEETKELQEETENDSNL